MIPCEPHRACRSQFLRCEGLLEGRRAATTKLAAQSPGSRVKFGCAKHQLTGKSMPAKECLYGASALFPRVAAGFSFI
jgi:hypothetical protein